MRKSPLKTLPGGVEPAGSGRFIPLFLLLLVTLVTMLYFFPFRNNFFSYDDFGFIEHIQHGPRAVLLGYSNVLRVVAHIFWWPLDYLSGFAPLGYSLFSGLLWLVNALLLFRLLRQLLGESLPAALAAFIFCASAVGSDAFFWHSTFPTLLNATFYLLALHAYVSFRQSGAIGQWRLTLLLFTLAAFCKEDSASLPLVVLLLEWLYFNGQADLAGVGKRFAALSAVVLGYLLTNYLVVYQLLKSSSEIARLSSFRPLHSLLSGWSVFFVGPDGRLVMNDPRIYLAALLIPASLLLVRERKLLLFGLGWVFLAFLPQSLSGLAQFDAWPIFRSLSRFLYLPAAGAAIAYAGLYLGLRERFSVKTANISLALFLILFLPINYQQVERRGLLWQAAGESSRLFLATLRQQLPHFPPNSWLYVGNARTGRAYVLQSVRVAYRDTSINWIEDLASFVPPKGANVLIIECKWQPDGTLQLVQIPFRQRSGG